MYGRFDQTATEFAGCKSALCCTQWKTYTGKELPDAVFVELDPDLETAAEQIHKLELDILYYWEVGTDSLNYFLPFFKAARLQVGFWGWPVTSGIARDGLLFVHAIILKLKMAQQFYTEKLFMLPGLPVYYYRPPVPEVALIENEFGFE